MGRRLSFNGFQFVGKLLLIVIVCTIQSDGVNGKISEQRLLEVGKKLKMLNKPAVKSIQSEDGDIIDCVDIYKQPAFDHPALRNHTIQLKPSFNPAMMETKTTATTNTTASGGQSPTIVSQLWQRSGSCPKGTVPIRRIKKDLLRVSSIENYGRKRPYIRNASPPAPAPAPAPVTTNQKEDTNSTNHFGHFNLERTAYENRSIAHLITLGYNYIAAAGNINVWSPRVDGMDEYSTGQIWLISGPFDKHDSVEAGWVVNPAVYGDKRSRFFAYWTSDSSFTTGCFDLTCSGFVQTDHQIALGAALWPISSFFGSQYEIGIYIFKDLDTNNWWLQYGNIKVGYWPGTLFDYLDRSAISVWWGGEVYSPRVRKIPHTTTQMGSGNWAEVKYGGASYIANMRIMNWSKSLVFPDWIDPSSDEVNCYGVNLYRKGWIGEPKFYFGGPGQNPLCK